MSDLVERIDRLEKLLEHVIAIVGKVNGRTNYLEEHVKGLECVAASTPNHYEHTRMKN